MNVDIFPTRIIDGVHTRLCVAGLQPDRYPHAPLLLLLHGAFMDHGAMIPWSLAWSDAFDIALADLPGHGRSGMPAPATFAAFADEIRFLVSGVFAARRVVIVGESLGGLIGLAAGNQPPANLAGIVALDPPLSTAKLWPVIDAARAALAAHPENACLRDFVGAIFGVSAGGVRDIRYHAYLEGLSAPALVLAGDAPLGERRKDGPVPSLLDEYDRTLLRSYPGRIKLETMTGVGHSLIDRRPRETHAAARNFIAALPGMTVNDGA